MQYSRFHCYVFNPLKVFPVSKNILKTDLLHIFFYLFTCIFLNINIQR